MDELFGKNKRLSSEEYKRRFKVYITAEPGARLSGYQSEAEQLTKAFTVRNLKYGIIAIILFCFVLIAAVVVPTEIENGYKRIWENHRWVFIAAGVAAVLLAVDVIFWLSRIKSEAPEYFRSLQELNERIEALSKEQFSIPDDAITAELFMPVSKIDGEQFILKRRSGENMPAVFFKRDGFLKIITDKYEYSLPLSRLISAETEAKRINFSAWLKEEKIRSANFKQYKIGYNNGTYSVKQQGVLIFESEGRQVAVRIMPYDFDAVKQLVGQ